MIEILEPKKVDTLTILTIQNIKAVEDLKESKIFYSFPPNITDGRRKAYSHLMKKVKWVDGKFANGNPIFGLLNGNFGYAYGANPNGDVALLEIKVPRHLCLVHEYYRWSDYLFYYECPEERKGYFDNWYTLGDYLDEYIINPEDMDLGDPIQVIIPYIDPSWSIRAVMNAGSIAHFRKLHCDKYSTVKSIERY